MLDRRRQRLGLRGRGCGGHLGGLGAGLAGALAGLAGSCEASSSGGHGRRRVGQVGRRLLDDGRRDGLRLPGPAAPPRPAAASRAAGSAARRHVPGHELGCRRGDRQVAPASGAATEQPAAGNRVEHDADRDASARREQREGVLEARPGRGSLREHQQCRAVEGAEDGRVRDGRDGGRVDQHDLEAAAELRDQLAHRRGGEQLARVRRASACGQHRQAAAVAALQRSIQRRPAGEHLGQPQRAVDAEQTRQS